MPIDLVLLVVLFVVIVAAGARYTVQSGGPGWIVVGGVAVVGFVWAFVRRIRRRDESVVAGQRKVGHDESWTSGKEDE